MGEALGLVITLGVVAAVIVAAGVGRQKRLVVLQALVAEHHGTIEKVGFSGGHRLKMTVDDLAVVLELIPHIHGQFLTIWRVAVPAPGLGSVKIGAEGLASFLGTSVGVRDVELGVGDFDERFAVRTKDPAATRRLMTPERCMTMVEHYRDCTLKIEDGQIELRRVAGSRPLDREDLDRGLAFVGALARADVCAMAALDALPDVSRETTSNGMPCVQVGGPGTIRIGPHLDDGVLLTRATSVAASQVTDLDLTITNGEADAEALAVLAAEIRAHVRELGTARLRSTREEIVITWPTIEDDPRRLTAAIHLLRALGSAPALGAFR